MLYTLGIAVCCVALLQMGMWISLSFQQRGRVQEQFATTRKLIEQQILESVDRRRKQTELLKSGSWKGFREFVVERLVKETESVTSVYLKPTDGKPIAEYQPGQHLSLKFQIPGEPKAIVRCYSLSAGPNNDHYRISVKAVAAPPGKPELPEGKVSNFINKQLLEGDCLEVKAPNGSFVLNESGEAPIILLAGGIGITPMASMIGHLVRKNSDRLVVLFYGVRCGREHVFKEQFGSVSAKHPNLHVVNCYSDPEPDDQLNRDYQVQGFVSIDILKRLLPNNQCQFYLCGPPPFMHSLFTGLQEWGVPENRIKFEAFGPASLMKSTTKIDSNVQVQQSKISVSFVDSNKVVQWDSKMESLLELAEAHSVPMDSGCRAGSCGTCATKLSKGKISYPDGRDPECDAGECLACIAKPDGDIELVI